MDDVVKAITLGERTSRQPLTLVSDRFESSEWVRSKRALPRLQKVKYTPLCRKDGETGRYHTVVKNGRLDREFREEEPNRVRIGNKIYFDYGQGIRFMGLADDGGR